MSQPKSAVSALQELCAKNKVDPPIYVVITDEDGGFICKVEVMDVEEIANGRSKRDAKHFAALRALKRLAAETPQSSINLTSVEIAECEDLIAIQSTKGQGIPSLPPVDTVAMLRNYCVQNDHPLPKFELISQYGTPDAPRFTMLCQIASIKRHRTADSKKTAKQLVAFQMFLVIKDPSTDLNDEMELVSIKSKAEHVEEERVRLFNTYRELVESNECPEQFGTPLFEKHNALKKFHAPLKEAAFWVLNSVVYESSKSKVYDLFTALKLNAKIDKVPSVQGHELIYVELDVPGLDVCFAGYEDTLYDEITQYFRVMLV